MDHLLKESIKYTLDYSTKLIISPDMDGLVSAQLLNRYNGSTIVGTYDKNVLCLADGIDVKECLFVDCDMNHENFVSIGNHMRLVNDNVSSRGFNPNQYFGINKYTSKFPFATAYLIAFGLDLETSATDMIRMAYADSTLKNMENYSDNMRTWSDRMNCPSVEYVIRNSEIAKYADDTFRAVYPNQSLTSKRYGKERYIQTLNDQLTHENVSHETLVSYQKYKSDKIGLTTLNKYMSDIMSYAEIYQGEYSVTYYDKIDE
jgi:hypothetical protein